MSKYRTDWNFGVQLYKNEWILVSIPDQSFPHCSENREANQAADAWRFANRVKFEAEG